MSTEPVRESEHDPENVSPETAALIRERMGGTRVALPERVPVPNTEQGLYRKYDVRRTDGSDAPGGKHHGCEYFVLDVAHDPHARPALAAYVASVEATHPQLAADLRERYGITKPTQQESGR
ncbi:hypothetical protein [Coralloluteibacterium thermophilus]|uniref:Uncharacterized protein n=1 Tax=Coralloluteibacterium thermophilum TaxID=2707049 RepID=A0ABV9NH70_9GAMM